MKSLAYLVALLPVCAVAEPQPAVLNLMHYMDTTAACFDGAEDRAEATACIGLGAKTCMDAEQDGHSTVGMMFCMMAETEAWDRVLNRDYVEDMEAMRAMDVETAEHFPQFANRASNLLEAQRAWIAFRDAQCGLEYAVWGAGSMRQVAGATCHLDMTAERVIYLRFLGDEMR